MSVTAIIVTRGDVELRPVLETIPAKWQTVIWNNGDHIVEDYQPNHGARNVFGVIGETPVPDLSVYGRYAAIDYADGDLIYVQDDDVVVSEPEALVAKWVGTAKIEGGVPASGSDLTNVVDGSHVVCNMPPEFRHEFYEDHALVGFGAVFHRDSPARAFAKFTGVPGITAREGTVDRLIDDGRFLRTCDIVFTGLTPRVLADVPRKNLHWAHAENRMWKQPDHISERAETRELVRKVIGAQ